jgi:hypothetical protein
MAEKPEYLAFINPVRGLSEAEQRERVAKFQPKEEFVVGRDGGYEDFVGLVRPPRVVVVALPGVLAENRGKKPDRVDSMVAMKVAVHRRKSHIVDAKGRNSLKNWPAMMRDGDETCRRLAQGLSSAANGRRGAEPYEFKDTQIARFVSIMRGPGPDAKRLAKVKAYCKAQKIECPRRTWLKTKLIFIARERGLIE